MKLYGYWRSTSSYRLRIALNLKGLQADGIPVHLVRGGGEQHRPEYRAINPQGRLPSLVLDDGAVLIQSPAIIEYLEEAQPQPPLLPADLVARAKVRAAAAIIGCDIHRLDRPLDRRGLCRLRDADRRERLLLRPGAGSGRLLSRAAGLCGAALQRAARRLSAHRPRRCPCGRTPGLQGRASVRPTRRRIAMRAIR
jgi:glutathione S-transferase